MLTETQIAAITSSDEISRIAFEWANAMCERHTDHIADCIADLWGAICFRAGVRTDVPEGDFTPMLVHIEPNDDYVADPLPGRTNVQCYAITEAIVYILVDASRQVIELDPIKLAD